jgi:hypothetical protein
MIINEELFGDWRISVDDNQYTTQVQKISKKTGKLRWVSDRHYITVGAAVNRILLMRALEEFEEESISLKEYCTRFDESQKEIMVKLNY